MRILAFAICLLAIANFHAAAQTSMCPSSSSSGMTSARRMASSDELAPARARHGLPTVDSLTITTITDGTVCARIERFLAGQMTNTDWRTRFKPGYYRVGAHYYVVLTPRPNSMTVPSGHVRVDLRVTPLYILDEQFALVAAIAR